MNEKLKNIVLITIDSLRADMIDSYHLLKISDDLKPFRKKTAVTVGVFDGVHRGHQELIRKTVKSAKSIKGASVLVTFAAHPDSLLKKDTGLRIIKNMESKIRRIKMHGIDVVVLQIRRDIVGHVNPKSDLSPILIGQ